MSKVFEYLKERHIIIIVIETLVLPELGFYLKVRLLCSEYAFSAPRTARKSRITTRAAFQPYFESFIYTFYRKDVNVQTLRI